MFFSASALCLLQLLLLSFHFSQHAVVADMYMNDPHVIELNEATFESIVMKNEHTVMVKFYAPWCGHCVNLHSTYSDVAKSLKNSVILAAIDCTKHGQVCQAQGVRGYPTLKAFHTKPKLTKRSVTDYNGQRTAGAISQFLKSLIPNHVKSLGAEKGQMTLASFFELKNDTLPKVLITKSKATRVNDRIVHLAAEYRFKLLFGEHVDPKYEESALYVIPLSGEPVKYAGELKLESLKPFLAKFASKKRVEAPAQPKRDDL